MTGPAVAILLLMGGFAAVFGLVWLASPKAMRRRPEDPNAPKIIISEVQTGRSGRVTMWSTPSDPQEYSKIWSDDRK